MGGHGGRGGHEMGGPGWCREMLKKRAWEYLDKDQTRQMILRMTGKKILLFESRMHIEQQKLGPPG